MRGSVAFLAVFAVTSCSVGVNGADFVKPGTTGFGTGRGNEEALGIEGSYGGNGGHIIGKRSSLGHDLAKQAAIRSAAARRRQMTHPDAPLPIPNLAPPIVEVPLPGQMGPTLPPESSKPWSYPPEDNLPSRQAMPSVLEREMRILPTFKFRPLSKVKNGAMKISYAVPHTQVLPAIFPKPSAGRFFARSQDFYRSDLKNRQSGYSGLRSYSHLRSYQTLPGTFPDGVIGRPLYKQVRSTAPAQPGTEENFRREVRSAFTDYLVHLWNEISKWFKPDSNSGGGTGGLPPKEDIPIGGGSCPPGLCEAHTERPPEENVQDVIIEVDRPPEDDDVEIIHLSLGEDAPGAAKDSVAEAGSVVDDNEPILSKPPHLPNWEVRRSMGIGDDYFDDDDYDSDVPVGWQEPMNLAKSMRYPNRKTRRAMGNEDGSEDVASKTRDNSARTRREKMRDDSDTQTDIFGRMAHD